MAIETPRRNLELKARDHDPARSAVVCRELGAVESGVLAQRDTYFRAPRGRLKLREEEGAKAHLVSYLRPDRPGSRESRYRLVPVEVRNLRTRLGIEDGDLISASYCDLVPGSAPSRSSS